MSSRTTKLPGQYKCFSNYSGLGILRQAHRRSATNLFHRHHQRPQQLRQAPLEFSSNNWIHCCTAPTHSINCSSNWLRYAKACTHKHVCAMLTNNGINAQTLSCSNCIIYYPSCPPRSKVWCASFSAMLIGRTCNFGSSTSKVLNNVVS